MKKKFVIVGFLVALLVAIPATVYVLKMSTQGGTSRAAPSTVLSLSTTNTQLTADTPVTVNIIADPGANAISVVKLELSYDSSKLATTSSGLAPNTAVFPTTLTPPTYGPCTGNFCTISATFTVGADPTKAITSKTTIATITFQQAPNATAGSTNITFGSGTIVYSVAQGDQASENVLSSTQPLALTLTNGALANASQSGTLTPTPTLDGSVASSSGTSNAPICTSLSSDQTSASSGATINFTANGNSQTGVISKVTFNFGDTTILDVTTGGGIGTNNVSAQQAHTYTQNGIYTANVILTDNLNNVSDSTQCQETITIGTQAVSPTQTITKLPITGPGITFIGIGIGGVIATILGGLLFFGI